MTQVDPRHVQIRPAATVMLVRDGTQGIEVFMLRRNPASAFVGGAFVFPGGAVDEHDHHHGLQPYCVGVSDPVASATLGVEGGGLAYWVAAIRECFEEAGLLLAYDDSGEVIRFDDPHVEQRFVDHRLRVDRGELRLADLCAAEGLTLACDSVHYFSHWITPEGPPRRYDTRFFVARAPDAQVGLHDDRETVANLWIRPDEAIDRSTTGEFEVIYPTIRHLELLAQFSSADEAVAAARRSPTAPPSPSRLVTEPGGTRIVLPGDPGYEGAAS